MMGHSSGLKFSFPHLAKTQCLETRTTNRRLSFSVAYLHARTIKRRAIGAGVQSQSLPTPTTLALEIRASTVLGLTYDWILRASLAGW